MCLPGQAGPWMVPRAPSWACPSLPLARDLEPRLRAPDSALGRDQRALEPAAPHSWVCAPAGSAGAALTAGPAPARLGCGEARAPAAAGPSDRPRQAFQPRD